MKQNKLIKPLLIAVVILLMTMTFVACDNSDNKTPTADFPHTHDTSNSGVELTADIKQLVENSRVDTDAAFNCFLTAQEADKDDIIFNIAMDYERLYLYVRVDENSCEIEYYLTDNEAKQQFERYHEDNEILVGSKIIKDNSFYQELLKVKRPSKNTKFTQEQMQFMDSLLHRGVSKNEGSIVVYFDNESDEQTQYYYTTPANKEHSENFFLFYEGFLQYQQENYQDDYKADIESGKKLMSINYTADSFIDVDEKAQMISFKVSYKPGWHIIEQTNYMADEGETVYTGKYTANYTYIDLPSTINVPNKISGYDIEEAKLNVAVESGIVESVIIENEMKNVYLQGNIKEITIPLSEKPFVQIGNNVELETINFGGTMQQWTQLQNIGGNDYNASHWTRISQYNSETGEYYYTDITFNVVCTDGSITYPNE